MIRSRVAFVLLCICVPLFVFGGNGDKKKKKQEEKWLEDAEYYFEEGDFLRALPLYKNLSDAHPDDAYYHYQLGICYLYKDDEKDQAVVHLEKARDLEPDLPRINFYLGRAYHLNYRFDDAIASFNKSMTDDNPNDKEKKEIQRYIQYCNNAKVIMQDTADVQIRNVGYPVNTDNSEYAPVISIDETTLIFTYRGVRSTGGLQDAKFRPDSTGDYYEDIFVSQKVGDRWLDPDPISNNINTNHHDACVATSNDGQILFIFKSTAKDGGDLYMSTLNGDVWSTPVNLGPNVNTPYWEGSCSLSSDGQLLYFASDRPGGMGGRDIYVSHRQSDGTWGPAENLGPAVNTPYNDDAPFIHPDGINLFFCSEGHNSMGGYDLFYTHFKNGAWQTPVNLGYPVNTPSNERYYTLTADGGTGYYSSDRRGGLGQQDIYTVTPGFQGEPPILALVVGFVTVNGTPANAKIDVTDSANGNTYGNYHSNAMSGKYLIALKPGNTYKVAIEVDGFDPYFEYVNVKGLDTYVQVNKDYNFVTPGDSLPRDTTQKMQPMVADSNDVLQKKIDDQLKDIRAQQNDQVYEQRVYQQLLKRHGSDYDSTVNYVVDLGTYQDPKDFDSTKLTTMGPIHREVLPDGMVRYSVGPFKTMLDAELYRSQLANKDSTIASNSEVVVYKSGVRQTIPSYYHTEYRRKDYVPRTDTKVVMSRQGTLNTTIGSNYGYNQIVNDYGTFQADGLTYKLEISDPKDTVFFAQFGKIETKTYPDGHVRYYLGPWNTLKEADDFRTNLVAKDSVAAKSLVTVFYFGQRKTVPEFFASPPCNDMPVDLTWFKDKSLNDTAVYRKFLALTGNYCHDGLIYTVQIGAYRHPENFKYPQLADLGPADIRNYNDSITRFTMRQFKTIREAEAFRQVVIKRGITDAWITATYKGERKTLEELIDANFYGANIQ
ncbi:MAG TPA: tetratricopeptide repeat protein [Bacteroidia bacterium]|nr:tetratricopeptide repeat protein [Bacteroidia bacterium]